MKKYVALMMMVLTVSLASLAGAAVGTIHDLNSQMNGEFTQAGNWAYGWSSNLGNNLGDFGLLDTYVEARPAPDLVRLWVHSTEGGPHLWYVTAGGNFFGANAGEHGFCPPDGTVNAQYTTFRWTAPAGVASAVDITGLARPATDVQVKEIFVAKNGTPLFQMVTWGTQVDFTGLTNIPIAAGDWIDFAINRYDTSSGNDWCGLQATITEVPEPMTMGLLTLGGLALLRRRR